MSIEIPKVSFFMGAGASIPFGYPATKEFLEHLNNTPSIANQEFWESTIDILQTLNKNTALDVEVLLEELEDYEKFLSELINNKHLKNQHLFGNNKYIKQYKNGRVDKPIEFSTHCIRQLAEIKRFKEQIYKELYDTYANEYPSEEDCEETLKALFKIFQSGKCDIFTTNYDTCIERLFFRDESLYSVFSDGFDFYQGDIVFKENFHKGNLIYRLFKLHGSVNWKRDPDDKNKIHRVNLKDLSSLEYHPIVYPGTKEVNEYPFDVLYKAFEAELKKSLYCVIIGFSFSDIQINQILLDTLNSTAIKYIIWNPEQDLKHNFPEDRIIKFPYNFTKEKIDDFKEVIIEDFKSSQK